MMRAESSILRAVEIIDGVATVTAVREIGDSSRRSHLRLVMSPAASCTRHVLENAAVRLAATACEA